MSPLNLAAKLLPIVLKIVDKCDSQAWSLLGAHEGKTICFDIEHNDQIFLKIANQKLEICQQSQHSNVTIKGNIANFIELLLEDNYSTNKIHITGDIECAQALFETINHLDLDFESPLANIIGTPLASTLAHGFKTTTAWKKDFFNRRKDNIVNFIKEESGILPSALEVQSFINDVDILKNDVSRIEARIALLTKG
jgi:ubiquinone biosynthesis protein UbiJ